MRRPLRLRHLVRLGVLAAVAVGAAGPAGALSAVSGGGVTPPIITTPNPPVVSNPPPTPNEDGLLKSFKFTSVSVVATGTIQYDGTPDSADIFWGDANKAVHITARQIAKFHTPGVIALHHTYKAGNGQAFHPFVEAALNYGTDIYYSIKAPTITPLYAAVVSPVFFRTIGTCPTGGWTAKTQLGTGEGESAVPAGPEVDVDFPDMGPQWATFAGSDYTTSLSLQWAHDNSPFRTVFVYHGTDEAGIATSLDPSLGARDVSIRESLTQNGSCSIGIKTHVAFALIVPSTSDPKLGGIVVAPPVIKA